MLSIRRAVVVGMGMTLAAACHDTTSRRTPQPDNLQRTISNTGWDSLPLIPVSTGSLVCLSDGQSPCPFNVATANWMDDTHFASWQLQRQVQIWSGSGDPMALGDIGSDSGKYNRVSSVAKSHGGYVIISNGQDGSKALLYSGSGKFQSSHPVPPVRASFATGYSGQVPFLQEIVSAGADTPSLFVLKVLDAPGDTIGHRVLSTPIPWLYSTDGRVVRPIPLFQTIPSYAFADDTDLVWSPGDIRTVERVSSTGKVRWHLSSTATGDSVQPAEIDSLRPLPADTAGRISFDSSVVHTRKVHAAVISLLVAPDGRVLLMSFARPASDSVEMYVLSADGAPTGRLALPRRSRPMLFGGDSVLVQRPGANLQLELRWLRLGAH